MVKCEECGFLSKRAPGGSGVVRELHQLPAVTQPEYLEVPIEERRSAYPSRGWFECFAAEHDLGNEKNDEDIEWEEVVRRPRECAQWMEYVLGHTPKEHAMMRRQERLEAREDARDKDQRCWQQRESDASRDERKFNKWTRLAELGLILAAVIATVAAVFVAVDDGSDSANGPVVVVTPRSEGVRE